MPVPQPDEVIELANELKEARSRVAELEARWNEFFTHQAARAPVEVAVQFLKPRIIQYLEANPKNSYSVSQVSESLSAKENSVGPYLAELVKAGLVERRGRGLYGALTKDAEDDGDLAFEYQRENPQPIFR